jgi:DNA primase
VNEDKGFYHCFGCGAHGDAIGFVMAQDGLTFMDAVKSLAAEAGLTVPEPQRQDPETAGARPCRTCWRQPRDWFRAQLRRWAGRTRAPIWKAGGVARTGPRSGWASHLIRAMRFRRR